MSNVTYKSNAPAVKAAIHSKAMGAIKAGATEHIYAPSQMIVPLDESPLQNSGAVTEDGNNVYVSYGTGESREYAVIQHENLQYAHAPGRQAKYLEQPFRTAIPLIISDVANALKSL